ncbi:MULTISPECIES: chemotaxis protein CheC [Clostridium]|uniref:ChEC CheY-P phosphatase CheC n=1 Tax=Clostridium saccharoperbutylacetonicum N1-4(HMT) TaxID=931276 RepID=M1MUI5_9CLOT|nr:chemotaxis protein CheC [Clostridium saccharoperbutylacetonicum]AGF58341.1 chEC CheY-P phosphatase CheC [Clostridium saccharoperbutylacetonicum N1-4(HMT)]AQR97034.1 CheY-P phosphatase CheC [Clostridium saccharoperbutylacetonicum]NRT60881.1 chemotaxis protein CheC [Clostridium saccharoperbutylacetonicum]NSB24195.1 chemotaxis protein CheC [Clostridium saccharoperbutylacetonicum]NSB32914.1 chemotaxis protein CheC [Clostridium saccharoperbutylacetonicum]
MEYSNLSALQLDALKEVSNIGAGNAATALSMMIGKKIDMTVPAVNVVGLDALVEENGEIEVAGTVVRVLGDIAGNILLVFDRKTSDNVIRKLVGSEQSPESEMGKSVLCEIANIISASYMNSIAQLTNLAIAPSVPATSYDMLGAILTTTFIESNQYDEYILDIETVFLDYDTEENIGGHFYYIPMPGSLERILQSIGIN